MNSRLRGRGLLSLCLAGISGWGQPISESGKIELLIPAGAPLRVYLTKRVPKRLGAPVEARLLEPVYAFDRELVPAGVQVLGRVSRVTPVSKWQRARAILGGDFTPLRSGQVEYMSLIMPDGRKVALHTAASAGLNSNFYPRPLKKQKRNKRNEQKRPQDRNSGVLGVGRQTIQDQINSQLSRRTSGVADIIRAPNKKERLVDMVMAKLPYHPQWLRRGTRFDAELREAVRFGSAAVPTDALSLLGSEPDADTVVHARLITPLGSATATKGQPVEAVMVQPLCAPDSRLLFPEGTRLKGTVAAVRKARWFHRGGRLRFNLNTVELPPEVIRLRPAMAFSGPKAVATLEAAESGGKTPIQVDKEGAVKTKESKTRFVAPAISVLIANKSMDNDTGRAAAKGGADGNVSGRVLGGISGFGLLGALVSQSSRYVGTAFGFYGMAMSVYSSVVARGGEIEFQKNAMIDVRLGPRISTGREGVGGVATAPSTRH